MEPVDPVVVGRMTAVHGIKGWVKVHSFTEPEENILHYSPWWLKSAEGWQKIEVDQHRAAAKGLMVHLVGVDDRDIARQYCQRDIAVEKASLPALSTGEYYWHQLKGLAVLTSRGERLGVVTTLMETGANDVLVVKGDADSLDRQERLIPYAEQFILGIDLGARQIEVDWDPDF